MITTLELNASQSIRLISLQVLETRYQTHQFCSQIYGWQIISVRPVPSLLSILINETKAKESIAEKT